MRYFFRVSVIFILLYCTVLSCSNNANKLEVKRIQVDAPYGSFEIEVPDFAHCPRYSIVEFGAEMGDKEKTSQAIARAITKANDVGGGVVVIPEGTWMTKAIHFKSRVNLYLSEGAVLLFSGEPEDYLPPVYTTWEGMECYNYSPLIYAFDCENIAITGPGKVEAVMDLWQTWFARPAPHLAALKKLYDWAATYEPVEHRQMVGDEAHLRPHFLQFNRCDNVLLEDFSIKNSPFWVIHPYLCKNVVIRGLDVYAHGHNNDGVDPDMTQNMLIENCHFDQGDDAIAVKSGRNQDAWKLNTPCKNIVIKDCLVENGHQLLAIGSELSGGVENVFITNCRVAEGAKMFNVVFIKTNERRGGYVKNIYASHITAGDVSDGVLGIETDVLYQWRDLVQTYEVRLTPISHVYLDDITAGQVTYTARVLGQANQPVKNVHLQQVTVRGLKGEKAFILENMDNFTVDGLAQ